MQGQFGEDFAAFIESNNPEEWADLKGALQAERPTPAPAGADDGQASSSGGGQDAPKAAGGVDGNVSAKPDVAAETVTRAAVETKARPPTGGS